MSSSKPISPSRRRAWHNLAVQAQARVTGQDILFKGIVRYDFPRDRPLREEELSDFRKYLTEKTKLSIKYSVGLEGIMHPEQLELPLGQSATITNFESVATYTMQVWQYGKDDGMIGMYFRPCNDETRLEKMQFRAIEFTPDPNGKISPARDEELRHKLSTAINSYLNKENIETSTFPTISNVSQSQAVSA